MNFLKKLIVVGVELVVLYFVMRFIAMKWVLPFMDFEGDVGGVGQVLFLGVLVANTIFYIALSIFGSKIKAIFISLIAMLSRLAIVASTLYLATLWLLFLVPIILFLLHLGVAKLLAKKN